MEIKENIKENPPMEKPQGTQRIDIKTIKDEIEKKLKESKLGKLGIKKSEVVVVVIPDNTYSTDIIDVIGELAQDYSTICYVSLNKSYESLKKPLEEKKIDIDKFLFLDAVAKTSKPDEEVNRIIINSVSALTDLSIAITKAIENGRIGSLIFDSLSTMLIYHDDATVTKFVHDLISKTREVNCTTVLTCLEGDAKSSLIKDLGMFVDKVITTEKVAP